MNKIKLKPGQHHIDLIRNNKNVIVKYEFCLKTKRRYELSGEITREEMEFIYKNYSYNGANLTQTQIAKEFPRFSSKDIKHIFRIFNITKNVSVLPPHLVEELSSEKALEYVYNIRENILLKKIEKHKLAQDQKLLIDTIKENQELKEKLEDTASFFKKLNLSHIKPIQYKNTHSSDDKNVAIYLSDMHIGAEVNNEGVYDNKYNEWEVSKRLFLVYSKLLSLGNINELLIMNLGDALDGYNSTTTRIEHTHILPQNMSNREQIKAYISIMYQFFQNLSNLSVNKIKFVSVCESNHGGDFEYAATLALQSILVHMGVECYIANRPIEFIKFSNWNIVYLHGKDNQNMFKNFPLYVTDKVESYFNEYLIRNNLRNKTLVVKGDLHQSATTKAKLFDYKSVSSLFGSSNWIHANFGSTPWGCDYSIFTSDGNRLDGVISDK